MGRIIGWGVLLVIGLSILTGCLGQSQPVIVQSSDDSSGLFIFALLFVGGFAVFAVVVATVGLFLYANERRDNKSLRRFVQAEVGCSVDQLSVSPGGDYRLPTVHQPATVRRLTAG